jgi:hypothetical protein
MTGRRANVRAAKRHDAPEAAAPQAWWQIQAQEEAVAAMIEGINREIAKAMMTVRNEDVDALIAERGAPQDLVNGVGAVLSLLWVKARWNGMAETEATKAALTEAQTLGADLLLKAWVRGAKGGGSMQPDDTPDLPESSGVTESLTEGEQDKKEARDA